MTCNVFSGTLNPNQSVGPNTTDMLEQQTEITITAGVLM